MMFRSVALFTIVASALSVAANPTHLEQRDAAADNIVYVTDANKFWWVLLPVFTVHSTACSHARVH